MGDIPIKFQAGRILRQVSLLGLLIDVIAIKELVGPSPLRIYSTPACLAALARMCMGTGPSLKGVSQWRRTWGKGQ